MVYSCQYSQIWLLNMLPGYHKLGYFIINKTEKPFSHTRQDFENPGRPRSDRQGSDSTYLVSKLFQSWLFHNKKLAKVKITFEQKCSLAPLLAGWLCPNWSDKVVRYNVAPTGLKKMTSQQWCLTPGSQPHELPQNSTVHIYFILCGATFFKLIHLQNRLGGNGMDFGGIYDPKNVNFLGDSYF